MCDPVCIIAETHDDNDLIGTDGNHMLIHIIYPMNIQHDHGTEFTASIWSSFPKNDKSPVAMVEMLCKGIEAVVFHKLTINLAF